VVRAAAWAARAHRQATASTDRRGPDQGQSVHHVRLIGNTRDGNEPLRNPSFDFFTALSDIGDAIQKGRQQSAVNDALTSATGPDGTIDFGAAMAGALQAGDLKTAAALGNMAKQQYDRQKDARDFALRESAAARPQRKRDRDFDLEQRALDANANAVAASPVPS
jgi:hypothetical protein